MAATLGHRGIASRPDLPHTRRAARRAAYRGTSAELLQALGHALLWGAVGAVVLTLLLKLAPMPVTIGGAWWAPAAVCLLSAAGVGSVLGWRRAWSETRGASALDTQLALKDKLRSALELQPDADPDPIARALRLELAREAEALAPGADVARAVRVDLDNRWVAWPLIGVAAFALAWWVPEYDWGRRQAAAQERADRLAAAAELQQVVEAARPTAAATPPPATAEALRELEELQRELDAGRIGAREARLAAAEQLTTAAAQAEERARAEAQTAAERDRALAELTPKDDSRTRELADALRRADLAKAEAAARVLAEQSQTMSDAERQQLAHELSELARQLDQLQQPEIGGADGQGGEAAPQRSENTQASETHSEPTAQDPQQQQPRDGTSDQAQPAQPRDGSQPNSRSESQPAREQGERNEDLKNMSEALRQAAEQMGREGERRENSGSETADGQSGRQSNSSAPRDSASSSEQSPKEPAPGSSEQSPAQQSQSQSGQPQSGQPQSGQPQSGQPQSGNAQRGEHEAGTEATPQSERSESGTTGEQREGSPAESGGAAKGEQQPKGGSAPGGGEPGLQDLAEQLKQMRERGAPKPGGQDGRDSQRLREQAQRLLDKATPEQREELQKLAQQLGQEPGGGEQAAEGEQTPGWGDEPGAGGRGPGAEPGREGHRSQEAWRGPTQMVDARGTGKDPGNQERQRVVSEIFDPKAARPERGSSGPAEALREATAGAERAVETLDLPREQRELVRRVFKRYNERAK